MSRAPVIDCHVHLVAHATGGCFVAPALRRSVVFRWLRRSLGLHGVPDSALSDAYVRGLRAQLDRDRAPDAVVLLAFDGRYGPDGRLDEAATPMLVTNEYCAEVCRTDRRFLLGASVNPRRRDALDQLALVHELGAVCVKTVPNTQDFDPAEPALRPFFRRMADLGLPWLTHSGNEHTLPATHQAYGHPARLVPALDEGVTVIAAHAGGAGLFALRETFEAFVRLTERYGRLFGDISGLGTPVRARYYARLLDRPALFDRMLYGSDYPVPSSPWLFARRLGLGRALALRRGGSVLGTPLSLARALGVPEGVLTRASVVLRLGAGGFV
jgi:predicted TIM-barrel fold metal-dependent hydrolase